MTLLNPLALGLLAVAIPIILMYILKLRRQERLVSSTLLWQRALDDLQANAPWQRLRPSVLLFLQLLALAALVFALVRPAYTSARTYQGDLIVIVDQSFGMQARDIHPDRFAAALAKARALTSDLAGGSVMSVIGMGPQPQLAIAESDDAEAVRHAIDGLQAGTGAPNVLAAMSEAASLARGGEQTRAVLLTSRESGIDRLPLTLPFPVEIVRIGGNLHDLGLAALSAVGWRDHVQALARVANFGGSAASSDVRLYVDGQLADVRPVTLAAGAETTLFWDRLPAGATRLQVHITRPDDMPIDKDAFAVVPQSGVRRVLLVSRGDYFLQTALQIDPSVRLSTIPPDGYTPGMASAADVVVFDGALPSSFPAVPTLVVSPPQQSGPLPIGSAVPVDGLTIVPLPPDSGLSSILQYVSLSDVHVARAHTVSLPSWAQPVVQSRAGQPLLAAGDDGSERRAFFTFNLQESDWPLRVSFPVVVSNLLHYLSPGLAVRQQNLAAGSAIDVLPAGAVTSVEIDAPDGGSTRLHAPFAPYSATRQPGFYTVREAGVRPVTVAVSRLPARTAPAAGPSVQWLGSARPPAARHVAVPVDVGWVFGLFALAVLTAEWWFAFRR